MKVKKKFWYPHTAAFYSTIGAYKIGDMVLICGKSGGVYSYNEAETYIGYIGEIIAVADTAATIKFLDGKKVTLGPWMFRKIMSDKIVRIRKENGFL